MLVMRGEAGPAIETFRTLYGYGANPDQVMLDLLDHCHGASVGKAIGPQALVMPKDQAQRLAAVGAAVSAGTRASCGRATIGASTPSTSKKSPACAGSSASRSIRSTLQE